jgi:dTDP-4-dehydrorhamnose 3,5-epimerase
MQIKDCLLPGIKLVTLSTYRDERGQFSEWFRASALGAALKVQFVQDNFSRSNPGVFRGLHAQFLPAQSKLIGVSRGKILDIVLDLRHGSPTFGKTASIELDELNRELLWIPAGFAHGFFVLGDQAADVFYKCDVEYSPQGEIGIAWDDHELGLKEVVSNPILSKRDGNLLSWAEYLKEPRFEYTGDGGCLPLTKS